MEILGFTVAPVAVFLLVWGILRMLWELGEPWRDERRRNREKRRPPRE